MYERFTDRARKVMQLANQEAQRLNHEYIGTEHILLGLIKEGSGVAANVLKNLDIELRKVREEIERLVTPSLDVNTPGKLPQTPRAKKVVEYALEEARNLNHNYVGTEHILLGLLREEEGVAAQVLLNLGLNLETVREGVVNLLAHNMETGESSLTGRRAAFRRKSATPALDSFGEDLTARALDGRLSPVAGRAREIEDVLAVFLCRERRGALLVGDPGLGVAEVVEGLAQLLAAGDVPFELKDRRLVALDLNLLAAEAHTGGGKKQPEKRFKAALSEARRGEVILFLRDLRLLLAASAADLASLLWAAVRDRHVLLLASATAEELRERIEANAVLRDLFQAVAIQPSSRDEALATLRTLRSRFAAHHQVRITDGALEAAVTLAPRWLPGRRLTDAAAQLLDCAGALRQLRSRHQPPNMKEIDEHVERLNQQKEAAVNEADFEKAAYLRDQADHLKKKKEDLIRDWLHHSEEVNGVVDEEAVREVAGAFAEPETPAVAAEPNLLTLEGDLLRDVAGQRRAVAAVAGSVRRGRSGLADPNRPGVTFLFVGPTGTGKTLLARRLAERMFGDTSFTQIDMARFATAESGERLADALSDHAGGVLVLDRIDRAHPAVRDRLLPLLEEGVLRDRERRLDFRSSVVILTTTAGGEPLLNRPSFVIGSEHDHGGLGERVLAELGPVFGPELLARVEPVLFRGLSRDELRQVLDRELEALARRLAEEKGLSLKVDGDARDLLVDETPLAEGGAHPLRRAVEQQVLEPLAEELLRGRLPAGASVTIHTARAGTGRRLVFDIAAPV